MHSDSKFFAFREKNVFAFTEKNRFLQNLKGISLFLQNAKNAASPAGSG
jgi:hypothetical protein